MIEISVCEGLVGGKEGGVGGVGGYKLNEMKLLFLVVC